jgi:hypothetical protein
MSYDPVDVLAAFADEHGITYPLLSDADNRVIRELGLELHPGSSLLPVDPDAPPDRSRGLARPGTFHLDAGGVVTDKWSAESHRVRRSGSILLADDLDDARHDITERLDLDGIAVRLRLLRARYHPKQWQRLTVELDVPVDRHVYVGDVPDGFVPLAVQLDGPTGLDAGDVEVPAGERHRVEGTDESLDGVTGCVRLDVPFVLDEDVGDVTLGLEIALQSCTDSVCFVPVTERIELHLAAGGTLDAH